MSDSLAFNVDPLPMSDSRPRRSKGHCKAAHTSSNHAVRASSFFSCDLFSFLFFPFKFSNGTQKIKLKGEFNSAGGEPHVKTEPWILVSSSAQYTMRKTSNRTTVT